MSGPGTASAPRFQRRDWALAVVIALAAGALRAVALDVPPSPLLDEYWYARDGCFYWRASIDACGMAGLVAPDRDVATWIAIYRELTPEHPPLAKWLIGAPMAVLEYGVGAARLSSLVAGTATIFALFLLARLLSGSRAIATIAAGLLAVDFIHFVHSRIAMLDVFTGFFAICAVLFVTLDREQTALLAAKAPGHRWWRVGAAVAAGGAAATKLPGAAVVAGVVVLTLFWTLEATRNSHRRRDPALFARLGVTAGSIIVIAAVTYVLSYVGRLDGEMFAIPWEPTSWLHAWWERHAEMLSLYASRPSGSSEPWHLPMLSSSLVYFLQESPDGTRHVLLFGNQLLWWGGFAAAGLALVDWLRRSPSGGPEVVVAGMLTTYAGWLSLTLTGRPVFLYHAVPLAPFVYLSLAYGVGRVWHLRPARILIAALAAACFGAFIFYAPILTARPLDRASWEPRVCTATILWPGDVDGCAIE